MMSPSMSQDEHQAPTDDPIGAYATGAPPVFSQVHSPERGRINAGYLKSIPGILKMSIMVSMIRM